MNPLNPKLPQSLMSIPGVSAPPASPAAPPASNPLLTKLQSPMESLHRVLDQLLTAHGHDNPALLWVVNLLVAVAVTLVVAWAAGTACRTLGRYLERRHAQLPATLLLLAAPVVRWVLLLTGLSDTVEDAWPAVKGPGLWISGGLFTVAVILAVRGLTAMARTVLQKVLEPRLMQSIADDLSPEDTSSHLGSRGLVPLIHRIAGILLWLAGLILVLDHFGQNVSSVVAALGVTSLAIGLASQQALSNIIAGLVLALDHPFRVGDRIRLPGLDGGEVLELGLRSTQIRLSDGSLLIVPNVDLVAARLVNQTIEHAVRAEVRFTVPLPLDVDALSVFLIDAAGKVDPHPPLDRPPRVHLLAITDKLELALILWLPRHADAPRIEEQLRRVALRRIQQMIAELPAALPAQPANRSTLPPAANAPAQPASAQPTPAQPTAASAPSISQPSVPAVAMPASPPAAAAESPGPAKRQPTPPHSGRKRHH